MKQFMGMACLIQFTNVRPSNIAGCKGVRVFSEGIILECN